MTYSISKTFIGMTYATSIPTTVLGMLVEPLQAWLMPLAFPQLLWEQTFLQSLWERYTLTNLAYKGGRGASSLKKSICEQSKIMQTYKHYMKLEKLASYKYKEKTILFYLKIYILLKEFFIKDKDIWIFHLLEIIKSK